MDKQNADEKSAPKVKNFTQRIKEHKKILIVSASIIAGLTLIVVGFFVIRDIIEKNRNYFINIDDEFTFDCNLSEREHNTSYIGCEDRIISGTFSNYNTVRIDATEYQSDTFRETIYYSVSKSLYERDDFDINSVGDELTTTTRIDLYNEILETDVANKTVKIHFKLSEKDKELIIKKHNDWKVWKEAEEKAKAEAEARAKAETEAKAKAEAEEKTKTESSQSNASSNATSSSSEWKQLLKDYEAWVDKYIAFMKKYKNASATELAGMMSEYSSLMSDMTAWSEKVNNMEDNLSGSDLTEYLNTLSRISQKLSSI